MPKIKLTADQVKDIVQYVKGHAHPRFGAQRAMAEKYGISPPHVSRICCGSTRRNITFGMGLPPKRSGR